MKTIHYMFILILLGAVFFVEYDLSRRTELAAVLKKHSPKPADKVTATVPATRTPAVNPEIFVERFTKEARQIAKIQHNPELVQNRMKNLASAMGPQEVQSLYEVISNDKNDGEQRALAVELLSLKNNTAALMALQNFVGNNITVNGTKWDRKKELETVLRAQAVESIAAYPQKEIAISTLSYLQNKVDEKFLNDRIGRVAASLNNNVPALKQQDDETLKKLLE